MFVRLCIIAEQLEDCCPLGFCKFAIGNYLLLIRWQSRTHRGGDGERHDHILYFVRGAMLDITKADMTKAGFTFGDVISVTIDNKETVMPYYDGVYTGSYTFGANNHYWSATQSGNDAYSLAHYLSYHLEYVGHIPEFKFYG